MAGPENPGPGDREGQEQGTHCPGPGGVGAGHCPGHGYTGATEDARDQQG